VLSLERRKGCQHGFKWVHSLNSNKKESLKWYISCPLFCVEQHLTMMHLLEWGQLLAIFNFGNVEFGNLRFKWKRSTYSLSGQWFICHQLA
jgi:hypothetical protein